MIETNYRSDFTVRVHDHMGSDASVVQAARVSTEDIDAAAEEGPSAGLIDFLMRNRHGTPFEHNSMTFLIEAPIFVFREFHRHRIGWSYNEMSARYREMPPTFYVPPAERPLVQVGKPGQYTFEPGTLAQWEDTCEVMRHQHHAAYTAYAGMLGGGVAKEVARAVLPVGIYTAMFATCNARSLMSFLSLRTRDDNSTFPSYPQWEIERVAVEMETAFADLFPLTYEAWHEHGRVSP